MRYVIEHNRFTAFFQMSEQPVFPLDDVELVMDPSQLSFQAVANATQTRCLFTDQQRTMLPNLSQERSLPDACRSHDEDVLAQRMQTAQLLELFVAAEECKAFVHGAE
jgi:hypothetical protein